ncbi:MAG: PAS domain S-box protein [Myxococcales bacterium]|nr:PAS domain S-box protein [Myxococcales bacterium]
MVDVTVVDQNAAFVAVASLVPRLFDLLTRVRDRGQSEMLALRDGARSLSISAYPSGSDEAMILFDDITAREELEQRWRASQDRFEKAFHGNGAAMVIAHQSDLRIIDVNPRWLEMFGATRSEVIGRTAFDLGLIAKEAAARRIARHKEFAAGHEAELGLFTRAGVPLTVLASATPIEIAEGLCTLTTLIDITARKHAEEAFAVAFSASPAGMLLVHAGNDTVVAANDRLLEMTGQVRAELIGLRVSDAGLIVEPTRRDLLAEIGRTGRLDAVELQLARKGGEGVWTLASTEIVRMHDSVYRLTVFTDISSRKQFERRLLTQDAVGRCLAEPLDLETAVPRVLEVLCQGERWDFGAMWLPRGADGTPSCVGTWHAAAGMEELASIASSTAPGGVAGLLRRVLDGGEAEGHPRSRARAIQRGGGRRRHAGRDRVSDPPRRAGARRGRHGREPSTSPARVLGAHAVRFRRADARAVRRAHAGGGRPAGAQHRARAPGVRADLRARGQQSRSRGLHLLGLT